MALPIGDHVVNGVLSGVEARGTAGWMRYSILEEGMQYPTKVDTKKPDIIQACQALMGQQVSAQISVQDSGNPNPHQPGTNYQNRYLNQIGPAGSVVQTATAQAVQTYTQPTTTTTAASAPQPQQPVNPFNPDARDLKIYRQVAWKTAIDLANHGRIEPELVAMVQAAEVCMAYLVYGPARFGVKAFDTPTPKEEIAEAAQAVAEQEPVPNTNQALVPCPDCGAEPGQQHTDQCIPF